MTVEAVLFDKDGTLIDFGETFDSATRYVLDQMFADDVANLERAAEVLEFDLALNRVSKTSMIVAGTATDIAHAMAPLVNSTDIELLAENIGLHYGAACLESVAALPGTSETLNTLQNMGLELGIATNDDEQNATGQMDLLGLKGNFSLILGADSGFGAKPKPGMVTAFCRKIGANPSAVVMVGDSVHDLHAGSAAGCITCAVETGPADASELQPFADYVLPTIGDLPDLVKNLMK